jgi:hypothetical protein
MAHASREGNTIRNAVEVEILEIDGDSVRVRWRVGLERADECWLRQGDTLLSHIDLVDRAPLFARFRKQELVVS